jgi:FtsH-binding integral membrane protein
MSITEMKAPARRRWIVVGIAIVGGLIAAGGFVWITEAASAALNPFESPRWNGIPIGPGNAAFLVGSAMLLSALVVIRRRTRPDRGTGLIWVSVWCGWLAIALSCLGTELNVAVDGSIGAAMSWLGLLVGLLTAGMLILGILSFITHMADRRSHH